MKVNLLSGRTISNYFDHKCNKFKI